MWNNNNNNNNNNDNNNNKYSNNDFSRTSSIFPEVLNESHKAFGLEYCHFVSHFHSCTCINVRIRTCDMIEYLLRTNLLVSIYKSLCKTAQN